MGMCGIDLTNEAMRDDKPRYPSHPYEYKALILHPVVAFGDLQHSFVLTHSWLQSQA